MRLLCLAFAASAIAQDWDSLAGVKPDARLRVSLRVGHAIDGPFGGYTPDRVTVAARPVDRIAVKRIEVYRPKVCGRWKRAGAAAAIGAGTGFVIGASAGGCRGGDFVCFSRGSTGTILGATGAVIGFTSFVVIPPRTRYTIYRSR